MNGTDEGLGGFNLTGDMSSGHTQAKPTQAQNFQTGMNPNNGLGSFNLLNTTPVQSPNPTGSSMANKGNGMNLPGQYNNQSQTGFGSFGQPANQGFNQGGFGGFNPSPVQNTQPGFGGFQGGQGGFGGSQGFGGMGMSGMGTGGMGSNGLGTPGIGGNLNQGGQWQSGPSNGGRLRDDSRLGAASQQPQYPGEEAGDFRH
jgi:hypothetical protein